MRTFDKATLMLGTLLSTAIMSAPAHAQTSDRADDDPFVVQDEIVVTGSRIRRAPNVIASSPVTTINGDLFQDRGTINVEDLVNELPQVFAGQGSNVSNGASGTATVNLRGLGASRTLVLIDGKRMGPGSSSAIAPDLNQIPAALIRDVDVLTGGAGAVYGSDALAGVVNFKMDREFEGFRIDANAGFYQHNNNNDGLQDLLSRSGNASVNRSVDQLDGFSYDVTAAFGAGLDNGRGNVIGYVGYREREAVLQGDRDYSGCAFGGGDSAETADPGVRCVGSFTSPLGTFTDPTFSQYFFTLDEANPNQFRPLDFANDTFNFNPTNFYQRPGERITAGLFAEYEITDGVEAYADVMFMDNRSDAQIAFTGNFFNTTEVSCDNPFLSQQQVDIICDPDVFTNDEQLARFEADNVAPLLFGRRNVEGDPRNNDQRNQSLRVVGGLRGEFGLIDTWGYDVYASHSRVNTSENYTNEFQITRLQNALLATTGENGQPVCRPDLVTDPNCVPVNFFEIGGVTRDALDYIQGQGFQEGNVEQTVLSAVITGSLGDSFRSPLSDRDLNVVLGVEYRDDSYDLAVDDNFQQGLLSGQGGPTLGLEGGFDTTELFGEIEIPLLEEVPFAEDVTFNGAYRYSDNSLSGGADSYAAGLSWTPVDAVRLRGQYQRAVRAANAVELFVGQSNGLFNGTDPCTGETPTASLEGCIATGLDPARYGNLVANPAGQYNALFGGNPELEPETSDTYTLGAVIRPGGFLSGGTLSVDYFDITVDGFVGTIPPTLALSNCVTTQDPVFCDLINRDAGGSLWVSPNGFVQATNLNTGSLETKGVDVNFDYLVNGGGAGDFGLDFTGTYLIDLVTEAIPGADPYDCVGFYGDDCGTPNPEFRAIGGVNWITPVEGLEVRLTGRYFSAVDGYNGPDGTTGLEVEEGSFDETLDAQFYTDLGLTLRMIEDTTLRFGVNNVFDKEPPLSSSVGSGFGNGNTFPQVYDALGRYIFARATIDF